MNLRTTSRTLATVAIALAAFAAPARAQEAMTLQQVIERAQKESHGAQAARSSLEAARHRASAFDASMRPQISLSGSPSYDKSIGAVVQPDGSTAYLPRGEMQTDVRLNVSQAIPILGSRVFMSSSINRVESLTDGPNYWQSTPMVVGIEQDLFRPRNDLWNAREQNLALAIAEQQFLEATEDNATRAAAAYFDLYAAQLSAANAVANAAVNDSLYRISKGRYEVGRIAENDLLQSELAVLRAQTAVSASKLEVERATAALRIELNLPADAPVAIAGPPATLVLTIDTSTAVREALQNRSELSAMQLEDTRAQRGVSAARLSNMLSAHLTAGFGYNQTAALFDEAYRSPLQQQRFGLQVDMPLVKWGAGRAEVAAARADMRRVQALSERSRRQVAHDAQFAARSYQQAQSNLAVAAKADTVANRRFDVAKDRYVIGKIGIGDLYIAQTEKDAALNSYVEAVRNYWLAYHRLRRATLYDFENGRRIDR